MDLLIAYYICTIKIIQYFIIIAYIVDKVFHEFLIKMGLNSDKNTLEKLCMVYEP